MTDRAQRDAAQLRDEFDRRFAEPIEVAPLRVRMLAIGVGTERFLLRSSEITGLWRCPRLTSVPSRAAAVLGVAGLRGALVTVFDLARLVGTLSQVEPRWIVTCDADRTIALAFDSYHAHFAVPAGDIASSPAPAPPHVAAVATIDGVLCTVLDTKALLAALGVETLARSHEQ